MEALILIKGMFDVCGMVHQSRLVAMASLTSERPENTFSRLLLFWAHCSPHWVIGWLSHRSQLDWTTRLEWRDWLDWGEEGAWGWGEAFIGHEGKGTRVAGWWDTALVEIDRFNSGPRIQPCGTSWDTGWVTNADSLAWPWSKTTNEDLIKATLLM